jgi:hypothetical protein
MRFLPPSTLIVCAAFPTFADETTGKVQAFDRFARIIVMTEKTVWQLAADTPAPAELKAGDVIHIAFETLREDGLDKIAAIETVAKN